MLDITLFREEKGGDPQKVRESQRRRYANVELVDEVIELDKAWRQRLFELDQLRTEKNKLSKEVGKKKIAKEDTTELQERVKALEKSLIEKSAEVDQAKEAVDSRVKIIGNLVHDSVVVHDDEEHNQIVRTWGTPRQEQGLKNHVDLVELLEIADLTKGADTAGGRGYYLKGAGVHLNQALVNFGLDFLYKRNYTSLQTPFMMRKDVMAECAQLAQFDEELYKVIGDGDDKYLIATSEQPLCAYHRGDWVDPKSLPLRYAGFSTCFRKEAGAHGRDTTGIFRVHQFEKIEQFCMTSPNGNDSWEMHEEMLKNSEEFYQQLGLPYQVVSIVSGALNDAAAKKYDLEASFPASKAFRELVSCSNCTDYQSRNLEIRHGQKKSNDTVKHYVHLLNSTLVATERTICCILENYQTETGVRVPEVLQPYMMGIDFLPFKSVPVKETKAKKTSASKPKEAMKDEGPGLRSLISSVPEFPRHGQNKKPYNKFLQPQVIKQVNDSVWQLYAPQDRVPEVSVILFHGLQEDHDDREAYWKTWLSRDGSIVWPKEWLPECLPSAQILSVSYDSSARQGYSDDSSILARDLISDIIFGAFWGQDCPVILIGHSLGGIIIKSFLYTCLEVRGALLKNENSKWRLERMEKFLDNCKGVFYYSTPHNGSEFIDYLTENRLPLSDLMELMKNLSASTAMINSDFANARLGECISTGAIGESLDTTYMGFNGRIVTEASAKYGIDALNSYDVANANHFDVCKATDRESCNIFKNLLRFIKETAFQDQRPGLLRKFLDQPPGNGGSQLVYVPQAP